MWVERSLGAVAALALLAAPAGAFPTGDRFAIDPGNDTGTVLQGAYGDGIRFVGALDFPKAICSACHTGGPNLAAVQLAADDPSLFSNGYIPGQTYQLEVQLARETLGLEYDGPPRCGNIAKQGFVPCNSNGFALEADDETGSLAGSLCPTSPVGGACASPHGPRTLVLALDNHQLIASRGFLDAGGGLPAALENGATRWRFYWTAPPPGAGPVTFHAGVVDGNGGHGIKEIPQDLDGDDAVEAHISVAEVGNPTVAASTGCATAGRPQTKFAIAVLMALASLLVMRRRRPR